MAGGGNWEFQYYTHNRSNRFCFTLRIHVLNNILSSSSYTRDGILYMKPTLTIDTFSEEFIKTERFDIWGGQPGDK